MNDSIRPGTSEPTLTHAEVADLLGIHPNSLGRWRAQGCCPPCFRQHEEVPTYSGKKQRVLKWVYPTAPLRAWMEEHRPHQVEKLDAFLALRAEV